MQVEDGKVEEQVVATEPVVRVVAPVIEPQPLKILQKFINSITLFDLVNEVTKPYFMSPNR